MSALQRVGRRQRLVWLALAAVTAVVVGAHAGLELAVVRDLDPVIFAIDAGTGVLVLLVAALYLRAIARERRREVIERLLLDVLSVPRNIEATAAEAMRALADCGIGRAHVIALLGEGDGPLRPLAARGYPRGWVEGAPEGLREPIPDAPRISRPKTPHPWAEAVAGRLGKRPWLAEVPLRSGSDLIGVLLIADRRPGVLRDAVVLDLLATRLGAAFDHAALYEAAYARERDLEDLEARRREFMAAIAHEIRTPLTSIQAFADLLQMGEGEMDETAGTLVSSLGHGVMRLSSLVNDLIDLGRSGDAGYALQPREVDVAEVVRSAEATLRPALMLREQSVALELPDDGPRAYIDARILEQVTLNLLSNANRHSPFGGSITVSAARLDGATVRIEVSDSGPGIPPAERDRIFQPYYRIHLDGAAVPGSGLGLAVARRLLDECGGRIWADAAPDGGARFCVEVRAATPI
ncbi:MAG: HAMP domain-containing sensor histidine kinase [Dehalococcoidia bacterium]